MSNDRISTIVDTYEYGKISFQEYFVKHHFEPKVKGFYFSGIEEANCTKEVRNAIHVADIVIICPSNPFVSINPILSLPEIRDKLKNKFVVGVSPIIGSKAVKGPLAKIMKELKIPISPKSVLRMYEDFLNVFFIDESEVTGLWDDFASSIMIEREKILIPEINSRKKLAKAIIRNYIQKS